jgi:hypothetical protein
MYKSSLPEISPLIRMPDEIREIARTAGANAEAEPNDVDGGAGAEDVGTEAAGELAAEMLDGSSG